MENNLISRRDVFRGATTASAFIVAVDLGTGVFYSDQMMAQDQKSFSPNIWLSISKDNQFELVCHRSEMGQGVRTSMAMLIAEGLDVDLSQVTIRQAPGDVKYGDQNTDGSTSGRKNYDILRLAGATAREMLLTAASTKFNTQRKELTTESGKVIHLASNRVVTYGELIQIANTIPMPKSPPKLRSRSKLVGTSQPSLDLKDMTEGRAKFGMDIVTPNMVYASIQRAPQKDALIANYNEAEVRKVPGVLDVVRVKGIPQPINVSEGIAIIGKSTWATKKGRAALKANFRYPEKLESTPDQRVVLEKALASEGTRHRDDGDVINARKGAFQSLSSTYYTPYLVHAPMEPLVAIADVKGDRCEVWAPTQDPQRLQKSIAGYLGIEESKVVVNVTFLGGGFGRKSQPDFGMEAVQLSRQVGKPVKVVWSREDEIKHGFYHAEALQTIDATVDKNKKVTSWHHKTAFPTIMTVFDPKASGPAAWEVGMGGSGTPYKIPNMRVEGCPVDTSLRIGWLRSVCHVFHSFAENCFIDELADLIEIDPIDLRIKLIGTPKKLSQVPAPLSERPCDTSRLLGVIEEVRRRAKWNKKRSSSSAIGFACHYSFYSYLAAVVEVAKTDQGVKVLNVDIAIDAGKIINEDAVVAQMEGSVVFGLSVAKYGKISVTNGIVDQNNFHDYPVLRISETPNIRVHIVKSEEDPGGVGEPGVPVIAPALANALAKLGGERQRELPLVF